MLRFHNALVLVAIMLPLICGMSVDTSDKIVGSKDEVNEFKIESPHTTNWGTWGAIQHCPQGDFVYGMRAKIQSPAGIFTDDTALNGIELLCATPTKRANATEAKAFTSITSSVGHQGGNMTHYVNNHSKQPKKGVWSLVWTSILECPMPTFAVGFQLRSERNQLVADDSAGNDIKLFCSNGEEIGGFHVTDFGDWTTPQNCPRGLSLCGVQTQVEGPGHSDETSLNNVNMWCCDQ